MVHESIEGVHAFQAPSFFNNSMLINELILKVTNNCNLNCKYCYVFNHGDNSYAYGASNMTDEMALHVIKKINQHCKKNGIKDFLIIFHGGEPLLMKKSFYVNFCNRITEYIPDIDVRLALQTNGTLLSDEWIKLCKQLDISIGMSFDGSEYATRDRIFRSNGESAYSQIIKGIKVLHKNNYPVSILSVIHPEENPLNIYNYLKEIGVSFVDFLYPDKTYDQVENKDQQISSWLIELFDLWFNDKSVNKPYIRSFDIVIGLILGIERGNETIGRKNNKTICIKPNGDIQAVDNLMVCGNGFTKTKYNIERNTIDEALEDPLIKKYYNSHLDNELHIKCKECIIKNICGGGHLAHRYSLKNGFNNPSVYCFEIFSLVSHIQNRIIEELPKTVTGETEIEKLTLNDYYKND